MAGESHNFAHACEPSFEDQVLYNPYLPDLQVSLQGFLLLGLSPGHMAKEGIERALHSFEHKMLDGLTVRGA